MLTKETQIKNIKSLPKLTKPRNEMLSMIRFIILDKEEFAEGLSRFRRALSRIEHKILFHQKVPGRCKR